MNGIYITSLDTPDKETAVKLFAERYLYRPLEDIPTTHNERYHSIVGQFNANVIKLIHKHFQFIVTDTSTQVFSR